MKVLLTGITGYIGRNLAERLIAEGHKVYAIVRKTSRIDELPDNIRNNVDFLVYDNENPILNLVTNLCKNANIDLVYHLASIYIINHKPEDVKHLIESNITFATEISDAMKENGINKIVNTGTMFQHYENENYSPVNLYAATKQCFEDVLKFYEATADFKVISLHLFDTYGPNDKRRKIFNLFKEIGESGEKLKMSPGEQLLDMVYIDDIIDAFMLAGKYLVEGKYELCGTYGVSSGQRVKLRELVKIFENVSGKKLNIEWGGRPYREREIMIPWSNFKTLPNWQPKFSLENGIKKFLND